MVTTFTGDCVSGGITVIDASCETHIVPLTVQIVGSGLSLVGSYIDQPSNSNYVVSGMTTLPTECFAATIYVTDSGIGSSRISYVGKVELRCIGTTLQGSLVGGMLYKTDPEKDLSTQVAASLQIDGVCCGAGSSRTIHVTGPITLQFLS